MSKYIFPATFQWDEKDKVYYVNFPDVRRLLYRWRNLDRSNGKRRRCVEFNGLEYGTAKSSLYPNRHRGIKKSTGKWIR